MRCRLLREEEDRGEIFGTLSTAAETFATVTSKYYEVRAVFRRNGIWLINAVERNRSRVELGNTISREPKLAPALGPPAGLGPSLLTG